MFADVHGIITETIFKHTLSNSGWGMLLVGQDTEFGGAFDEGSVELMPWTASEGDDAHVVVGHDEPMCEHLQGIEGGIDLDVCIGECPLDSVGKTEKKWVARSKNDDGGVIHCMILLKNSIERNGDVYPFCLWRKIGLHNLMVALAA